MIYPGIGFLLGPSVAGLFRRWMAPVRLAFVSMAITVGLIAALGVFWLNLPSGAAILLGGIMAPTDPVLASGVQAEAGGTPDRYNQPCR